MPTDTDSQSARYAPQVLKVPVVQQADVIDPTPELQLVVHPNGSDMLAVVQEAGDRWKMVEVPGRRRARREHTMSSLDSFVRLMRRLGTPWMTDIAVHSACDRLHVYARLNAYEVHSDEIRAELLPHPKVFPWLKAIQSGEQLTVLGLHELVRESLDVIEDEVGQVILGKLARMSTVNTDAIEIGIAENGLVELAGANRQTNVSEKLPARFWLRAPLYMGAGDYVSESRIEVFLAAGKVGGTLTFTPRAKLALVIFQAEAEAVTKLGKALEGFEVGAGLLGYEAAPVDLRPMRDSVPAADQGSAMTRVVPDEDGGL